jgi:hypothetical protein
VNTNFDLHWRASSRLYRSWLRSLNTWSWLISECATKDRKWPYRDFASSSLAALKLPLANYGTRPLADLDGACKRSFTNAFESRSARACMA